ncbi:MAG: hypothetical protein WC335_00620 [Candidatus Omnitrophota bacterium]
MSGFLQIARYLQEAGFEIGYIDCLDRFHPALGSFLGSQWLPARKKRGRFYFLFFNSRSRAKK